VIVDGCSRLHKNRRSDCGRRVLKVTTLAQHKRLCRCILGYASYTLYNLLTSPVVHCTSSRATNSILTMMKMSPALESLAIALRIPLRLPARSVLSSTAPICQYRLSPPQKSSFSTTPQPQARNIKGPKRDPRISMSL